MNKLTHSNQYTISKLDGALRFLDFLVNKESLDQNTLDACIKSYHEYKESLRVPTNPATREAKGEEL